MYFKREWTHAEKILRNNQQTRQQQEGFLRMKFDFVFPVKGIGAVGRLDQIDTNNNNNEEYDD